MRFFSKIGLVKGTYFVKNVPNFQVDGFAHSTPRPLTVRVVYEVNYSCMGIFLFPCVHLLRFKAFSEIVSSYILSDALVLRALAE